MIGYIQRIYRRFQAERRERKKRSERSPHWHHIELQHLEREPLCQGCGSKKHLQVHHEAPFRLHPELELEPSNLITVCVDRAECHLMIAHGGLFAAFNSNVRFDLAEALSHPERRAEIQARAKANRKV